MIDPVVSVVIVSFNSKDDLLRCLASLRAHVTLHCEVVVVDNASADGSADAVREHYPWVRLVENAENLGFGTANNRGFLETRGPYVLVLNSDAEVKPGTVEGLMGVLEHRPEVGLVGPRTLNVDGTVQVSFGPMLTPVREWRQRRLVKGVRARTRRQVDRAEAMSRVEHEPVWVSGSCFLARREALEAVGGFDEQFFLYEEDVDLCVRVRAAGWSVLYTPDFEVTHRLGASMGSAQERARLEYHRSHLRFYEKHSGKAPTALLRVALALRAAASWTRSLFPATPGSGDSPHRELWRLATERRAGGAERRSGARPD